ncbi:hypothetical protein HDN1F_35120 [gamma proteobacterium HdN1]|nr:Hypothetical protein HDN1F_18060 [gamma proteobacterium HdN1]CBL47095.1 hypothetical protein HDN1F_35120 [gamma proteobacterium HdN1]
MRPSSISIAFMLAASLGALSGCANQVLPDTGPDIQEVYQRHVGGMKGEPARPLSDEEKEARRMEKENAKTADGALGANRNQYRPTLDGSADLVNYTRDAHNEIEQLFPVLPNPQIVMYVYPHFTARGRPVPGYSTAFKLYEREEYAMPGEWIADHPSALPPPPAAAATPASGNLQMRGKRK